MRPDYYELLDVTPAASAAEIKAAYYRQAKKYHPDRNGGSVGAEERFKLVAEAYRVLGVRARREDYDAWLERHRRLRLAPELERMAGNRPIRMPGEMAGMPRRTSRVSVRHAYERRAARQNRHTRARSSYIPRGFFPRRTGHPNLLHMALVYAMAFFLIIPLMTKSCRAATHRHGEAAFRDSREPGVSPLDEATQIAELQRFRERIVQAAEQGDPEAQFRYGCMLFHGYNGLPKNRENALHWLRKARDNGSAAAARLMKRLESSPGNLPAATRGSVELSSE